MIESVQTYLPRHLDVAGLVRRRQMEREILEERGFEVLSQRMVVDRFSFDSPNRHRLVLETVARPREEQWVNG